MGYAKIHLIFTYQLIIFRDFPGGPVVKNSHCSAGNLGLIPVQGTKIPHTVEQLSHVPTSLVAQRVKCLSTMREVPGLGRSPGEGNGNPLQYSCLENPMDGGAYSPWGHYESDPTTSLTRLSDFTFTFSDQLPSSHATTEEL